LSNPSTAAKQVAAVTPISRKNPGVKISITGTVQTVSNLILNINLMPESWQRKSPW
jgi:hypothetical protein